MFIEFFKFVAHKIRPKAGSCDVTIVRRYPSNGAWIGELYVDGRNIGMCCDAFIGAVEFCRVPVQLWFESQHRVLKTDFYLITKGDFTSKVPLNTCYIGSSEPAENEYILARLVEAVDSFQYIRLTVLNRPLVES